ncbi:hypothetical protein COV24_01060 [candidate division WWE3 bacterium CG10_big_fil_rev_8_21_14_0_10_32_10]|uniref:Uncharacterized protein n=1 Tax=candidate division WWE3 bacterium CG10_big_fil_rev_8_21_14_0_10_32_10 TaxID=1975090 RepID=A0A2H0RCN6_UNCKA|nr:MAG: hypothetical protein COV24_01060 [candidate division WWE3 bacterium CG10_big_fil_rev_8_21_14_0_10_32_10]
MVTTTIPYNLKVGLNLSHQLFKSTNEKNIKYLDTIFYSNEREAIGRRVLIIIYILEDFGVREISAKVGCGVETINKLKKVLSKSSVNKKDLLDFLCKVYYSQFPAKEKHFSGGSRTISGTKKLLGLSKKEKDVPDNFVPLYKKT